MLVALSAGRVSHVHAGSADQAEPPCMNAGVARSMAGLHTGSQLQQMIWLRIVRGRLGVSSGAGISGQVA